MDFVHLFADHHDTVHCYHEGELVIEPQHHHCDFLSFTLPAFLNDHSSVSIFFTPQRFARQKADAVIHLASRTVHASLLRGPPVSTFS